MTTAAPTELLERSAYLDELGRVLRQSAAGEGQLVLLGGEAGVGKTVLTRHFRRLVRGQARVLIGACDALSTPRPLGPLLDVAAEAGGELGRLLTADAPRHSVFRAVLDLLSAGSRPALLFVEDAHWADEATLDLLRYLGRRIGDTRSMVIVTYRDDEVGPTHPFRAMMGDLATAPAVRRMALPPLSESAVGVLAAGSGLDPVELHRRTGGNPFFVTEVLAAGGRGVPPTVRDAVLTRAARLSPTGWAVLGAAAVIGAKAEPWLLTAVAGEVADAVDECIAAGLLHVRDGVLAFRHELARTAVLAAMTPVRATALHQSVLAALRAHSAQPDDLARLAHHAEAAGDREAVLAYAAAAARRAAKLGAHREATAQYARALRFADELPDEQRESLLSAWFRECHLTGQLSDAIAAGKKLITLSRDAGDRLKEAEYQAWLAWVLVAAGRNAEAEQSSRAAVDLLAALPEQPLHAFAFFVQATLRMLNRDSVDAIAWGERAVTVAERFGDVEVRVRAINTVGTARLVAGDIERGRVELERSLALAREAGLEADIVAALSNLGTAHGEVYCFAPAERYLTEGIAYSAERDLDRWHWYMVAWLALIRLVQGRWTEATDLVGSVLRVPSVTAISQIMALVALGRVRARRGDPEVAATLDKALALAEPTGTLQRLAPVRAARAEAAWLAGNRERTRTEARAAFDLAIRHEHAWHIGELGFWLWKAGELSGPPPGAAEPFARQIAGDWAGASAAWHELGCPYEAARALADGDEEALLRESLAEFERLGARPAAVAVTRRLRELGARGIPRGPRPATRANPANLTPRELEILSLIAQGLRNTEIADRLFLSAKTVDHHVSAVLAKLGVRSRAEAGHQAVRLGFLSQDGESPAPR